MSSRSTVQASVGGPYARACAYPLPDRHPLWARGGAAGAFAQEVVIWHGEEDRNDPAEMARTQERRLRNVEAVYYPGEGHSILFSRIAEIVTRLVGSRA